MPISHSTPTFVEKIQNQPHKLLTPLALVWGLVFGGACDSESSSGDDTNFPEEPLQVLHSSDGTYSIEVRSSPSQPPERGVATFELMVHSKKDSMDDLHITATPWMASHGHGSSTKPTIEEIEPGKFIVKNVALFMPGEWQIEGTIHGCCEEESFSFDIDVNLSKLVSVLTKKTVKNHWLRYLQVCSAGL